MEQCKQSIDRIEVKAIKDQELDNILIWTRGLWDIGAYLYSTSFSLRIRHTLLL
jgi:hypothetical protein